MAGFVIVKLEQGKALVVNRVGREKPRVTFSGRWVWPVIEKAEIVDLSVKTIEIDRRGQEGLICKDNIRADIKVTFFVRVNNTQEDVLKVARAIGCERASDQATLEELFSAKFSEALKTVGKQMEFEDLYRKRDEFRDNIKSEIGEYLNGYALEDAAIDFLEQTPVQRLDAQNILDSQGIRKITELTTFQSVETNKLRRNGEMEIKRKDVEAKEAILELERQQSDAEAKQKREVESMRARENAETQRVLAEERLKTESARIHTDEQVSVAEENKGREIEVAQQNRARVVAIEAERVEKARTLEAISREREVELERIAKEKALEEERREIANVIRERIAVDKTVAEEEERIKELRAVAEADRHKQVKVIAAESEAQQLLVADLKAAEAAEQAAKFKAREKLTLAEAELETSDKQAQAKMRLAEGVQAEQAAAGLAEVRVKEANALAVEKQGAAEAKVMLEQKQAQAAGDEQVGLAQARVKEADATAIEKQGLAEAKVMLEQKQAQAAGEEQVGLAQARVKEADATAIEKQGLAQVRVKEADAVAVERQGHAEAEAIKQRLVAEAAGLAEKFAAMQSMGDTGREYEEFRLRLEHFRAVELESIEARKVVATAQSQVLGEAFRHAKIDIVGGDGTFFDRLIGAISLTRSMDRMVGEGTTARHLLREYLDGEGNLLGDIKDVLTRPSVSSDDLQKLTLSAFLARMIKEGDEGQKAKLQRLAETAQELGLYEAAGQKPSVPEA